MMRLRSKLKVSMGKWLKWKLPLIIVLGIFVFLWIMKAPIFSSYATSEMGVPVFFQSVKVRPTYTKISDFKLMNPLGFKTRAAFTADKAEINYRIGSLTSTPAEFDQILLEDAFLFIELKGLGTNNNWKEIGANMPKKERGKEVIIHNFVITNLDVEVSGYGLGTKKRHFDRLEFSEIDSREGFPTKELVKKIFNSSGIFEYIQDSFNPLNNVRRIINPFNMFGIGEEPSEVSSDELIK
jgi:hypothetical protein